MIRVIAFFINICHKVYSAYKSIKNTYAVLKIVSW